MLQRIQSIYFAIALACVIGFGFTYESWVPTENSFHLIMGIVVGVCGALLLGAIFYFKDRSRQTSLAKFAQWASLIWLAFVAFVVYRFDVVQSLFDAQAAWKIVLLLFPALVYILIGLAKRAIKADIELLKSADRIR